MTSTFPCRLITRQRSHIGLTEALTFIGITGDQGEPGSAAKPIYRSRDPVAGTRGWVRIRGPSSVTATVCSKWAERDLSSV
jgi:hypothetical protein